MGCCGSKAGETQEQIEPDQTKKRFRLISVKKPVRVPSRPAWNVSDESGPEISLSAQSFSIPMPPLTKKPSSPTIRRRSGVRLASSVTSHPSQKDATQGSVQAHSMPSTSTGSVYTPRPPTGKKSASLVIRRRSGVKLALASSLNNLRAEDQSRPLTPELADASKSSISSEDIQAAPEASQSFTDMTEALPSTSEPASAETNALTPSVDDRLESALHGTVGVSENAEDSKPPQAEGQGHLTIEDGKCLVPEQSVRQKSEDVALVPEVTSAPQFKEERQVFQGLEEQKEGIEEALGQSSGLVPSSFEPQDTQVLEVSMVTPLEQPQRHKDHFKSSLELDIEKAASVLVAQALRNAVAEVESERARQAIEDNACKAVVEPAAGVKSDHAPLEPAKSTHDDLDQLAKMLAQQAIEAASIDLGIPIEPAYASEASDIIPVAHHSTQVQNTQTSDSDQVAKIARIMSAKGSETAIHSVTSSGNDAAVHDSTAAKIAGKITANEESHDAPSSESDEELIVRGKAITISKATKTPKASGSSNNVKARTSVKKSKTAGPNEKIRKSRSVGTVPVKPQAPLKKKNSNASALGKSRSVGAVTRIKPTGNTTTKKMNRSLSLNTVVRSTVGTAAKGTKKSAPPKTGRTGTTAKKPVPLKTDSKPRRAENTLRAAKIEPQKKTLPTKGGNKLPDVAVKKTSASQGQLSRDKKAFSNKSNISEKVQVSRKTSNGLAGTSSLGSSKDKRAEGRKPDAKNVKLSRPGAIKKKSVIADQGQKKAIDLVSFQSASSQELSNKSSSPLLQVAVKSLSEKAIDAKIIPELSSLPSPKSQSPTIRTTAWVNEVDCKHAMLRATSPNMSPKGSSLSVTGKSSPHKNRSSSPFGSREKISVDKIPSSSPIRIRSGSSKHLQEL